jgi:hypothetical protein
MLRASRNGRSVHETGGNSGTFSESEFTRQFLLLRHRVRLEKLSQKRDSLHLHPIHGMKPFFGAVLICTLTTFPRTPFRANFRIAGCSRVHLYTQQDSFLNTVRLHQKQQPRDYRSGPRRINPLNRRKHNRSGLREPVLLIQTDFPLRRA